MNEGRSKWLVLTILAIAQFMIILDTTIVNVALPSIQRALRFSTTDLQWVVTAYTICFGSFLLLGGRTADLYGRRRMFIISTLGFSLFSLLIGITQSSTFMVPLRALQGISAAFMSPSALSIVLVTFQERHERTRALSIWGALGAAGASIGLLAGGLLTQYLSWRWNFFVNVPVGLFIIFAALKFLPVYKSEAPTKNLDIPGAVLVTGGLMLLVYTLTNANLWGWFSFSTIGLVVASIALLIAFVFNEMKAKAPLVPLPIFKIGNIAGANLTYLPIAANFFWMLFFLTLFNQEVRHYSPLLSGISSLPLSLTIGLVAVIVSPILLRRFGYKKILLVSPLFTMLSFFLLIFTQVAGSYWQLLPALIVLGIGLGLAFVSITVAATANIPQQIAGLASGLIATAMQIGGSLGLAVLSALAFSQTAYVLATQPSLPSSEAVIQGFHGAFYLGIIFAAAAIILPFFFIDRKSQQQVAKSV